MLKYFYNPYGYIEHLSIAEFLARTTFNAYEDMPALFSFGFAFGAFEKNTIFIVEKTECAKQSTSIDIR